MRFPKRGLLVKNKDIIGTDFGPIKIDKEKTKKFSLRHRGNVRLSSGRYYTNEEFIERRNRVLSKPLP